MCRLAGKSDAVVCTSHSIDQLYFFNPQDHADFLPLSMAQLEPEVDTSENSHYYAT